MKQSIVTVFFLLFASHLAAWGQTPDDIAAVGLPVLHIETIGAEEPTCDYVDAPEGAFGHSIANATKVPGRLVITLRADTLYDSGDYEKNVSGMTVKIRGNTSAYYWDKKPYKIKLQQKEDLLFRTDGRNHRDKNWLLLHEGSINLKTTAALKVSELMGMEWTPAYQYVNVYMNGQFRGVYMLIEAVEQNNSARVAVDKNSGYIIECDAYWWNEKVWFEDQQQRYYTFKYPDDDDVTEAQKDYIQAVVDTMVASIDSGTYEQYIDLDSWTRWLLCHDILGTYDTAGSNIFLTKHDTTSQSKLKMGPPWDFDSIERRSETFSSIFYSDLFVFNRLIHNVNPAFTRAYCRLWEHVIDSLFSRMDSFLVAYGASDEAQRLQQARVYEEQFMDTLIYVSDDIAAERSWFSRRREVLSALIGNLAASVSVASLPAEPVKRQHRDYTLMGTPVPEGYRGIIVRNGKKYVLR